LTVRRWSLGIRTISGSDSAGCAASHGEAAGSTVTEVAGGSHAVYVSQPEAIAAVIEQAAAGASAAK
jgi:hypothetical protein